jgi:hypothetical protein
MKRSKKGKPMSWCYKCQKDTVDRNVFNSGAGGVICSQCCVLKIKSGLSWVMEGEDSSPSISGPFGIGWNKFIEPDDTGRENSVGGGK